MADPHEFHTPKSYYAKEELLRSGRGGYFGPGNAQLPAPPMPSLRQVRRGKLAIGLIGGGAPAIHAATLPVAGALRAA